MQIPNSLQNAWKSTIEDGKISAAEYKTLVTTAMPGGDAAELDQDEEKFLVGLKSQLEQNGITKGDVPVGVLNFGEAKTQEVKTEEVKTNTEEVKVNTESSNVKASASSTSEKSEATLSTPTGIQLPSPKFPETSILLNWPGYNKEVNTAFAKSFGEKAPAGGKVPVLSSGKAEAIVNSLGFGTVSQLQQTVGAKQDNRFGPETFFRTKAHVATQINTSQDVDKLTQLKSILGVLGTDPEVNDMKIVIDQRIQIAQDFFGTKQAIESYFGDVNKIVGSANPKDMNSLVEAKNQLQLKFDGLSAKIKDMPQVSDVHKQAMGIIENAINALKSDLDNQNITQQKTQLVGEINGIVSSAVKEGLTTGDASKVTAGKEQITKAADKYPQVKDSADIKDVVKKAGDILDATAAKIGEINALIGKKEWTPEDKTKADGFMAELPAGSLKDKLAKAIEGQTDAAKLKEKNKSNLPTMREGLKDVIGNGFWNLENKDGVKSLFQLVAKQGLLPDAIQKMNVKDQTEAIKVLTKGIKFDKMDDSDKFNVAIARSIYENLSKSADVDDDIKKKVLPQLKKEAAPSDFSSFKIDDKAYLEGMKFSIGSDRMGNEKEAALTMARGIVNGEVPKSILGKLNRYELNDLSQFIEKKGGKEEKDNFLSKTVAQAYNEGIPVSIESLDRKEKSKVVKGVLDIEGVNESKVSDLLKKAGKKTIFETVKNENLSDNQLSIVGKHVNGDDMADEPKVGAQILVGMVKTFNKQEDKSPVQLEDIRKYIKQVDKDWWEDDNTMNIVVEGLGDGPGSEYEKFQKLAPATLDTIRKIAD